MNYKIHSLNDIFNDPDFYTLVPLTPERTGIHWEVDHASGCEKSVRAAIGQVKDFYNLEKKNGVEVEHAEIAVYHWAAWYKGKPSPEPETKKLWELEKK